MPCLLLFLYIETRVTQNIAISRSNFADGRFFINIDGHYALRGAFETKIRLSLLFLLLSTITNLA